MAAPEVYVQGVLWIFAIARVGPILQALPSTIAELTQAPSPGCLASCNFAADALRKHSFTSQRGAIATPKLFECWPPLQLPDILPK